MTAGLEEVALRERAERRLMGRRRRKEEERAEELVAEEEKGLAVGMVAERESDMVGGF